MEEYREQTFDEERALYGKTGVKLIDCRFDGPADGESALKESRDIEVQDCFFNLRYPFWHDESVQIKNPNSRSFAARPCGIQRTFTLPIRSCMASRPCGNAPM